MAHGLEYNTTKDHLFYPEYGRSVQDMLIAAKTVADPRERQATVEQIIRLMYMMLPGPKNFEDYREKLWKHAFRITNYELEVQPPAGVDISPEAARIRPGRVTYPVVTRRLRHYGHNVGSMIKKCIEMPDGPKKDAFTEIIASYMKLAFKTWNREHYVTDDVVKIDLITLSDGQLRLDDGHGSLDILANQIQNDKNSVSSKSSRRRGGRGRTRTGNGGGNPDNNGNNNGRRRRRK